MRFIHTADLHLGFQPDKDRPWGPARADAVRSSLSRLIRRCNEDGADLLLIAGDLFHRPPTAAELKEADALFSQLEHTRVVLIAGNHDHIRPGSPYAEYRFSPNVTLLSSPELSSASFPQWNLTVYGFSYDAEAHPGALSEDLTPPDDGRRHFLMLHGGDDQHLPLSIRTLSGLGWDYVALGHIHKPGISRNRRVAMPGSPEPLDRTETGRHGFFEGTLTTNGLNVEWHDFSNFAYTEKEIEVTPELTPQLLEDQLRTELVTDGSEACTLTLRGYRDPAFSFDAEAILRQFPVSEVRDETKPDYPWEEWKARPDHDLLARFIRALTPAADDPEAEKKEKALYYGVEALLATDKPAGSEVLR